VDLWEPKEQCIRWGPGSSHGKGHFGGFKLGEYFSGCFTKARKFTSDAFDIFYLPTSSFSKLISKNIYNVHSNHTRLESEAWAVVGVRGYSVIWLSKKISFKVKFEVIKVWTGLKNMVHIVLTFLD